MCRLVFNTTKLQVQIYDSAYQQLLEYRQINSHDIEKGGLLAGMLIPCENRILITNIITCKQIRANTYELDLDVNCLQNKLEEVWLKSGKKINYLGDWHTHFEIKPKPSIRDFKTFIYNYFKSRFDQNCLLYIIIGSSGECWVKVFNGIFFHRKKIHVIKKEVEI